VPIVYIPAQLAALAGGKSSLEVEGGTVRSIIDRLEQAIPGIRERLVENDRLRKNISVAVDGVVSPLGLMERVGPESEVHFVAAISGGVATRRVKR
jgi:molybdopterin converting factor small subunit